MTRLTDHRRFAWATTRVIVALALVIAGGLLVAGRTGAIPGLVAGTVLSVVDALLLVRSLSRFAANSAAIGARTLTWMMITRFLLISMLVGVVITSRGVDPIGVVVGVLLFPVSIVLVGVASLRSESHRAARRLDSVSG